MFGLFQTQSIGDIFKEVDDKDPDAVVAAKAAVKIQNEKDGFEDMSFRTIVKGEKISIYNYDFYYINFMAVAVRENILYYDCYASVQKVNSNITINDIDCQML